LQVPAVHLGISKQMLILGVDTSGKSGGITLASGDGDSFHVFESVAIAGGTFSAQLVPTVAALLQKYGFVPEQLDGFVVVSGPGSFTGLRVGLSAVKGLAEILQKPIASISLLEALAACSGRKGSTVATALDAGRNEIFCGLYQLGQGGGLKGAERLLAQAEFLAELANTRPVCLITSDHSVAELANSTRVPVQDEERPGVESVARLGLRKLLVGDTVSIEALDATYLRRSDAEIFFKGTH
jgi:tRNA threonylcarbamoyladenosine biosynthesis protein TsaB